MAIEQRIESAGAVLAVQGKPRSQSYGYDTLKVLQRVWLVSDRTCGKSATLENLEDHAGTRALDPVRGRYGPVEREQLLAISPATIDRLLKPYKVQLEPDGISTTHSMKNHYRQAIPIMTKIPTIDRQPGLVAIDTVAHCGLTAKGEYAFNLTVTDTFTGWTVNSSVKNKAAKWIVLALEEIRAEFPFPIDQAHTDLNS